MAIILIEARKLVYNRIVTLKNANKFTYNTFEIEETYYPHTKLTEFPPAGKVWVLGLASDDFVISRANTYEKTVPVQVGFQRTIDSPKDFNTINENVSLEQELREAIAGIDDPRFTWVRTEALRDENNQPFSFVGLREHFIFESYFTAFFKTIIPSNTFIKL